MRAFRTRRLWLPVVAFIGSITPGLILFRDDAEWALVSPSGVTLYLFFDRFGNAKMEALFTPRVLSVISILSVLGLVWLGRTSPGWPTVEVIFFALNSVFFYMLMNIGAG